MKTAGRGEHDAHDTHDAPDAHDAFVAIGSNLGDRQAAIALAVRSLDEAEGFTVKALSAVRQTEPVGPAGQGRFLNAVAHLRTCRGPRALLELCLATEARAGRVRRQRWGPRTLDLDVLLFDNLVLDEPGLTIPHPRMHERPFVLEPLAEIAPRVVHPTLGRTIEELWRSMRRQPMSKEEG